MKIGIVVYSQTGNTLSVAHKLKEHLDAAGHAATIDRIVTMGDMPRNKQDVRFEKLPNLEKYEALVFAAPVQAFSLCAVMAAYLPLLPSLSGKKVACFATKSLGSDWTGGNKAISMMTKAVQDKNGTVCGSGIVHWGKKKDEDIGELTKKIAGLF